MNKYVQAIRELNELNTVLGSCVQRFAVVGSALIEGCEPNDIDILVLPAGLVDGLRPDEYPIEGLLFGLGWSKTSVYPGDFWCSLTKGDLNILICKDRATYDTALACQRHCEEEGYTDKAVRTAYWRMIMPDTTVMAPT